MRYAEIPLFAYCNAMDGGLMRRLMVGRVGGGENGYAIWMCI